MGLPTHAPLTFSVVTKIIYAYPRNCQKWLPLEISLPSLQNPAAEGQGGRKIYLHGITFLSKVYTMCMNRLFNFIYTERGGQGEGKLVKLKSPIMNAVVGSPRIPKGALLDITRQKPFQQSY